MLNRPSAADVMEGLLMIMSPNTKTIYDIIVSNGLKPMSAADIANVLGAGVTERQVYDAIRYEMSKGNFIFEKYTFRKPHTYAVNPEYLKYA